ncbi:hypothetical protein H310_01427 [Aphanomyces invadans]|uniref:Hemerythrin-like domain-containing protein n=1 Tax=Aphanomyces invadans TaxID=157072 RepID=A0A024USN1_9STRA|nr:hypothetical protein H310_01427 [Aphanomyces invadans]ETW08945.1 hypothetical protein H310_01427 [Aphanomyces invadans]|eukprot:XP_008862750.1 hypothetical protein H310_01427 [Aphanomyces invadans]
MTTEASVLARLPALERLAELRRIEDVQVRRQTTKDVHAILMREWKQDRRWGGMGRHLVEDIHVSFRRGFEILVKKGEARREVNVSSFRHLDNNLHHHHSIEDQMWFPRLKQLHPECQSEVEVLERDHRKLIELESQVTSGDYAALVEFVDHLMDHLNREEMLSVPWLLDGTGGL